jgi:hypothetical protein
MLARLVGNEVDLGEASEARRIGLDRPVVEAAGRARPAARAAGRRVCALAARGEREARAQCHRVVRVRTPALPSRLEYVFHALPYDARRPWFRLFESPNLSRSAAALAPPTTRPRPERKISSRAPVYEAQLCTGPASRPSTVFCTAGPELLVGSSP